jgi:hypothetical protein
MTIKLGKETFIAGKASFSITNDYDLIFQVVQEGYSFSGNDVKFDDILVNAEIRTDNGVFTKSCVSIIGMEDNVIRIEALDKKFLGKPITYDNLGVWQVVVGE